MTRLLFILLLTCMASASWCQAVYPYQDIKLEKPSDYKATEPVALSAATFILTTPFVDADANRINALKFLSNWISGTKEYSFYMQGKVIDISYEHNLLSLYIAAMAKYTLENKTAAVNPMNVELNASKLVLLYCDDPKNNFKLKKKYRKILESN